MDANTSSFSLMLYSIVDNISVIFMTVHNCVDGGRRFDHLSDALAINR